MISWAYIAGFFDGEGTITKHGRRTRLAISQTSYTVLQEIRDFTGVGIIVKLGKRQAHWKDAWLFIVATQAEVHGFLQHLLPYLIVKRRKASHAVIELGKLLALYKAERQRSVAIHRLVHRLRKKGLTYREIGRRAHIDWGYARRIEIGER